MAAVPLDSETCHKSKMAREWLEMHLNIILIYLPVDSPCMDAIKIAWGICKGYMGQTVCHGVADFRKGPTKFLRTHRFKLDVRIFVWSLPPGSVS